MKKKEKMSIIVCTACGVLAGTVIGGAIMMKLTGSRQDERKAAAAEAIFAELPAETSAVQTFAVTTMTFTMTTTTTTTTFTTMTTTTTAPPPPPLENSQVAAILMPAKDELTLKYRYSDSDTYEYYSEWGGFRLPFTTESAHFTYNGVMNVGIDPAKIEMAVNNVRNIITVKLPDPEVFSNDLDEDSIRYYDVHSPLFGSSDMNDYRSMIRNLKNKQADKVMDDDAFLSDISKNAEKVIRNYLAQSDKTAEFTVQFGELPKEDGASFEFLPSGQDSLTVPTESVTPDEPADQPDAEPWEEEQQDEAYDDVPQDMPEEEDVQEDYNASPEDEAAFDAWLSDPAGVFSF